MKNFTSSIIVILLAAFVVGGAVFAFTAPSAIPPGDNVDAPLNVGLNAQTKIGDLTISNGTAVLTADILDVSGTGTFNSGGAPNGLIIEQGNVGIGTLSPGESLEVVGIISSTGIPGGFKFPDGTIQTTSSVGGGGGARNITASCTRLYGTSSCSTTLDCGPGSLIVVAWPSQNKDEKMWWHCVGKQSCGVSFSQHPAVKTSTRLFKAICVNT